MPKVQSDPALLGCLDDFLGAIYALIFAKQGKFKDRVAIPIEVDKVEERADQLARGKVRTDGQWMAGFHFNSALFRTAAVYNRILQVVTGRDGNEPTLRRKVHVLYRQWKHSDWTSDGVHTVHEQVNELKHEPKGAYNAPKQLSIHPHKKILVSIVSTVSAVARTQNPAQPASVLQTWATDERGRLWRTVLKKKRM